MDPVTFLSAIIVVVCSVLVSYFNYRNYRRIGTRFFLYISISYLAFFGWSTGYLLQSILMEEPYLELVHSIASVSNSLSWIFVAFLITSTEYAKKKPNRVLIETLFLLTGLGIILYFEDAFFFVEWTGSMIRYVEGFPIALIRFVFMMLGAVAVVPVFIGIFKMFKKNPARFDMARKATILLVISGVISIATLVLAQSSSAYWSFFIVSAIAACIFISSTLWILEHHPTLFLAARHDLVELIIVAKNTGLPLYSFGFEEQDLPINPEIVSAFVTSAGIALQEAMQVKSYLERFHFGESEAIITEGLFVYGIILTRSSSDLLNSLLKIVVDEFEAAYWFKISDEVSTSDFAGFDPLILKMFEFDVPKTITSAT